MCMFFFGCFGCEDDKWFVWNELAGPSKDADIRFWTIDADTTACI